MTGNVTTALALLSLDAFTARQALSAYNVSHAGTPGHQPLRLSFESHLSALREAVSNRADDSTIAGLISQVSSSVETAEPWPTDAMPSLRTDQEISLMVQNSMQYDALVTVLNRNLSLMKIAVSGEQP